MQATQEEMMKKFSTMDEQVISDEHLQQKSLKKHDYVSKRIGWKGWSWKQSPAKSSSIDEEPSLLDSPKISQSSKSSTPNQSPKHRYKSSETVKHCATPDDTSFRRRNQQQKSGMIKTELRSSASARLIQFFDSKEGIDKLDSENEFHSLLPENGRPASIHVLQTIKSDDF